MNEAIKRAHHDLRRAWRYRWVGAGVAWAVAVAGGVGVSLIKDRYEASAKVYVDTQTVLKPLMAGLAFQPDIDQQVKMLARTLITRPNVEHLIKSPTIGLETPAKESYDKELDRLKDKIKFVPSGAGNLFSVSYRDVDPQRAQRLVDALLTLFVESGNSEKKRDSAEAGRFIEEQIRSYETKLTEAETRLKDFKVRNFGATGVGKEDHFARVSALSDEVMRLRMETGAAIQARDAIQRELKTEDPQLPAEGLPAAMAPQMPSETEARLDGQRRQLDELLRRYTDDHPDVIAARRAIAQLEQRQRDSETRSQGKGKGTAPTNPVFQKLRVSMAEAEAKVASLQSQLRMQQTRLEEARAMANRVPQAEADLAQLNRDYEIIRKNYEQLVARREAASLGVKIDQSSSLADFRVVEPPSVSSSPVFPGKRLLALAVIAAALAAGLVASFGVARFIPTIDDADALREAVPRPVLGTLSMVTTEAGLAKARKENFAFAGMVGVFLLVNAGWLAWVGLAGRA